MAKLKRTGDCFESAGKLMVEAGRKTDWVLVHGAPTGLAGDANGIKYPHAWIEIPSRAVSHRAICFDTVAEVEIPAPAYYALGNIKPEETVRYTWKELFAMLAEHGTYGPWDDFGIALNETLDEIIAGSA